MGEYTTYKEYETKYMNKFRNEFENFLYEKGLLETTIRILRKYTPFKYSKEHAQALEYLEDFELNFILGE